MKKEKRIVRTGDPYVLKDKCSYMLALFQHATFILNTSVSQLNVRALKL